MVNTDLEKAQIYIRKMQFNFLTEQENTTYFCLK